MKRLRARTVIVLVGLVVVLLGVSVLWVQDWRYSQPSYHLDNARRLMNAPDSASICRRCDRREHCKNGDPYQFYFRSTYGRDIALSPSFMIIVITLPDGTQYFKIERPFDYSRARVMADEPVELPMRWAVIDPDKPLERGNIWREHLDIWSIRNAKDHTDLRALLTKFGFEMRKSGH